ncbi:unnamed protein product, partial [Symbiodinium pilosum]
DCMWYSDFVTIPGEPKVNEESSRTFNVKINSGEKDWSRKNPWRAPGKAPVFGSGCGIFGGLEDPVVDSAGNLMPSHIPGTDGKTLPEKEAMIWPKGSAQEVAWAITANHGGGYSYRLCPKSSSITEECFQKHVLRFATDKQWIRYGHLGFVSFRAVQLLMWFSSKGFCISRMLLFSWQVLNRCQMRMISILQAF